MKNGGDVSLTLRIAADELGMSCSDHPQRALGAFKSLCAHPHNAALLVIIGDSFVGVATVVDRKL